MINPAPTPTIRLIQGVAVRFLPMGNTITPITAEAQHIRASDIKGKFHTKCLLDMTTITKRRRA
jgi:hypothetical protein